MATQTLLIIDAHGLKVWNPTGARIEPGIRFDGFDERSAHHFGAWLQARTRNRRYTVLADLAEERFALERLPRTSRADQRAMIARKLSQHFPDTRFTTSLALGRQDGGAGLNRVLLGALTRPALLTPWLGALDAAGAVITRLTSTPLLLDQWNRRRLRQAGQFVLLMLTATGMRLTLFVQGRLRFSRVVPARGASLAECQPSYCSELAQTRSYLATQHLIDHDAALKVTVLAHRADQPVLRAIVGAGTGLEAEFIDLHQHLLRHPRTDSPPDSDATALILQQLVRCPPTAHYTPPELQREHTLGRLRSAIIGAAGVTSATCLIAAGLTLPELAKLDDDIAAHGQAQLALTRQIDTLIRERPPLPVPAPQLDTWLNELDRLGAGGIAPASVLQQISVLFDDFPQIQFERLNWRRASVPRDRTLLPSDLPATAAFVVVDIDATLPTAPAQGDSRRAAFIDRLQQVLGPLAQVGHRLASEATAQQPATGRSGIDQAQHRALRLELRFALPIVTSTGR